MHGSAGAEAGPILRGPYMIYFGATDRDDAAKHLGPAPGKKHPAHQVARASCFIERAMRIALIITSIVVVAIGFALSLVLSS